MYKWFFHNVKQTTNHRAWKLFLVLWYPMGFYSSAIFSWLEKEVVGAKIKKKKGNFKLEKLESWKVHLWCKGLFILYLQIMILELCLIRHLLLPASFNFGIKMSQDCVKYITYKIYHKGSKSPCWTDIHLVQNSIRVPSLPYASSCFFAMLYCVSINN